ncbi:ComF family protein [Paenibacillus nasutitermitis]|uniref:Amidophosphoribosyltransferase n=1 Tax=Paenibacillus nasutitermitis TaxID=1652958 RepID=A0A916ZEE3_9BACL|nr:ComF family protein [Paenibacillus nasutitermitis]GGD92294.1 amidophosphoribosyltransferase [Paenibacillus nasutitermitis]
MPSFWTLLHQTLPKAIHSLTALLAPSTRTCLMCGSLSRHAADDGLSALCRDCKHAIPWIRVIHCPVCGRAERCPDCLRREDTAFICNRSAVRYNPLIREWLALYKYRGHEAIAPLLGEMLFTAYQRLVKEMSGRTEAFSIDVVIPVPVSEQRLLERGFNQAERLAAMIAERSGLPLFNLLKRTRHSEKQSFKTRGARLRDSEHLFTVDDTRLAAMLRGLSDLHTKDPAGHSRRRVLIVDDIYTTGSTVNACAQAVEEAFRRNRLAAGPEIYILTLARS